MCMPGDNVMMHVELLTPVAMEEGLRFAIREGCLLYTSYMPGKAETGEKTVRFTSKKC